MGKDSGAASGHLRRHKRRKEGDSASAVGLQEDKQGEFSEPPITRATKICTLKGLSERPFSVATSRGVLSGV